jgi:hypothetical protein
MSTDAIVTPIGMSKIGNVRNTSALRLCDSSEDVVDCCGWSIIVGVIVA